MQRRVTTAALVVAAFVAGALFHASIGRAAAAGYRKLDIFARVLSYVENNYVDPVDEEQLVFGAIRGMLANLDPHTLFLTPDEYREMQADTSGEFGGLGIEIAVRNDTLVVVAPIDDTPAARAGIAPGDQLLAIDGISTKGLGVASAVRLLRGAPGTRVTLQIFREGFTEPRDLVLRRDRVRVVSVESHLEPHGIGYVRVKSFQDRTDAQLGKALEELRRQHGGPLSGLVLDLRNNPGGLLDQAIRVADRFLTEGVIVTTQGRGPAQREEERAHPADTEDPYPLVILVNGGSASASEIVAGALQDYRRAVLLGTKTFGKGSVQTVIDLEDGSGLKLTVARYLTPSGRSIHEKGIEPDVALADGGGVIPASAGAGPDVQLAAALKLVGDPAAFRAATGRAAAAGQATAGAKVNRLPREPSPPSPAP